MIAVAKIIWYNPNVYDFILTDVDDTLLDFGAAERYALKKTHEINGISFVADDFLL